MNYPYNAGMPPLPNANLTPYPLQTSMPAPYLATQPTGFVQPPQIINPRPVSLPYPAQSAQSMPMNSYPYTATPYPQPAQPQGFLGNIQGTPYPGVPAGSFASYPSSVNPNAYTSQSQAWPTPGSNNNLNVFHGNPTVFPAAGFNPKTDAEILRKAMKGFGTDEKALIEVLCRRSNQQRQTIRQTFKTSSETSGNFRKILLALLTPSAEFFANELQEAMVGMGTDEGVLIEILCTGSNSKIHAISQAFKKLYGMNLENSLKSETSFNFKHLLVSLSVGGRDESGILDYNAANHDARQLLEAGVKKAGTDESKFNMIFCQRSFVQLKLIAEIYQQIAGHSLENAIQREFSGDIQNGLLAILQCAVNKHEFYAKLLHQSMAGLGTNDRQLIRLIVTRCEINLHDIKMAFQQLYGKSLKIWIQDDTSGDYRNALLALIGE